MVAAAVSVTQDMWQCTSTQMISVECGEHNQPCKLTEHGCRVFAVDTTAVNPKCIYTGFMVPSL